jgi:hypothetical protein
MFSSTKSKLISKLPTSSKEQLKRACSTAVSSLQLTLQIVKEAAGDAGVPGLQAGIGGLLLVIEVAKVDIPHRSSLRLINDK